MKVIFKVIRAGSGNDVYFERLAQALKTVNIDSEIQYYNKYFQYAPFLLKFFNKKSNGDVIHSNVEYGWVFKEKNKPLIVSLLHNVFEKEYQRCVSIPQKIYYNLLLRPNIKWSLKVADRIIAISNYTKESFEKEYKVKNISVVYCFIDTDKFKPMNIKT